MFSISLFTPHSFDFDWVAGKHESERQLQSSVSWQTLLRNSRT